MVKHVPAPLLIVGVIFSCKADVVDHVEIAVEAIHP
jgi:hypothetical protein